MTLIGLYENTINCKGGNMTLNVHLRKEDIENISNGFIIEMPMDLKTEAGHLEGLTIGLSKEDKNEQTPNETTD